MSAAEAGAGGGELGGVIGVGARADFGGACFFAAAGAPAGRGDGAGVPAAGVPARGGGAAEPGAPGSGVMMLTGGVEEAEGKSIIVVGLPGGALAPAGGIAASAPAGMPVIDGIAAGAPHEAE